MNAATTTPALGFADPVHGAQGVFRALLEAMARPGTIRPLPAAPGAVPGLNPAAAAALLTLADLDTPLWLDPAADTPQARAWLRFSCNAPLTDDPARAAFAVVGDGLRLPDLTAFNPGSPEYPDRSATLVLAVAGLDPGRGWTLRGPGIPGARRLAVAGLDPGFARARAALDPLFPMGLDVVLAAPGALACLPRTTRIEETPCT